MASLTKDQQKMVRAIATPIEHGHPVRAHVGVVTIDEDGRRQYLYGVYFSREHGLRREYVGPLFRAPRAAMDFAGELNARAGIGA